MTAPLALEAGGGTPVDLMPLALVLLAAWTAGWVASRWGYPAVLGELVAGIVLGPPLLGVLSDGVGLAAIGELGIVLMMLYIGTEIDVDDLRRASRAGLLAAIGGFVVPFGLGVAAMLLFGFDMTAAIFVGAAVGVTSLATKSRILADLQLFDTRIAYVLVAGALLSDTATLVLFAGVLSFHEGTGGAGDTALVAARAVGFFAIMGVAGVVAPRVGRWARERFGLDGPGYGVAVLVVGGLLAAALAEALGLHAILGSFLAGMVLRRGVLTPRTARRASEVVERISLGVLAPVFFVTAGFAISLPAARENLTLLLVVIAVATLGKVLGTALFYLPTGHGWREGIVVGGAMNGRGAVEIIVAGIGLERGLITTEVFTVLVLMAVLTTATVPVLLKAGVEWLREPRRAGGRGRLAPDGDDRGCRGGGAGLGLGAVGPPGGVVAGQQPGPVRACPPRGARRRRGRRPGRGRAAPCPGGRGRAPARPDPQRGGQRAGGRPGPGGVRRARAPRRPGRPGLARGGGAAGARGGGVAGRRSRGRRALGRPAAGRSGRGHDPRRQRRGRRHRDGGAGARPPRPRPPAGRPAR